MQVQPVPIQACVKIGSTQVNYPAFAPLELVRACVEVGNAAAWEEFVRRFHPVIAATVLKSSRQWSESSAEVIDDLIQETYLRICANGCQVLRDFNPRHDNAFFGLLKTIAFSVVQDHFRAQLTEKRGGGRRQEHLEDVDNANPSPARGMRQAEREILLREIDEFLSTVTSPGTRERDRCIFWLYYRHGLTARAISQIPALALTEKGVESTIWRLTQQVRQELAEGVLRTIVGNSRTSPKGKQAGSSF